MTETHAPTVGIHGYFPLSAHLRFRSKCRLPGPPCTCSDHIRVLTHTAFSLASNTGGPNYEGAHRGSIFTKIAHPDAYRRATSKSRFRSTGSVEGPLI